MDEIAPELEQAASLLTEELEQCHACVMAVFESAATTASPEFQHQSLMTATRLMQASAAAASALKRLKSPGTHHTVTVRPKGRGPTCEKLKTNSDA